MKKSFFYLFILGILTSLLFFSCDKDDEESRRDRIVGTWHLQFEAFDDNGNRNLDANEREQSTGITIAFLNNGSGTISFAGGGGTENITWTLIDDNTIQFNGTNWIIHTLTNDELILQGEDTGDLFWLGFNR